MPVPPPEFPMLEGLLREQAMARFTAARLGGPADYLFIARQPDYGDAISLLEEAWRRDMPVTVIGGGANVLVSDAGIRGLTILNRATDIRHQSAGDAISLQASSGANLIRLARYCQENALTGMEWAIAVPGTLGGAAVNNAGAHGSDIASVLSRLLVYEADGGRRWHDAAALQYAYRYSKLKYRRDRRFFVMRAALELQRDDAARIQQRMDHNNEYRRRTQPPGASLGSIFKNPPGDYAGRLIEAAGLKGARLGAVQVSPLHANFFVNLCADASASDYYALIQLVRRGVRDRFGVDLKLEIQMLGAWQ